MARKPATSCRAANTSGLGIGLERLHEDEAWRVAPAPTGKLRDELEGPFLGPEVGERKPGVGVDHRGELDAGEVMALRHHLRADENDAVGRREPSQGLAERSRLRGRVGVEPDSLQLGHALRKLGLESLRARPDASDLRRAALWAFRTDRLVASAVMAAQALVPVQRERDVAQRAAA